ncbi:MAG: peroxidase family protein [Pseudomonadota bacterium]
MQLFRRCAEITTLALCGLLVADLTLAQDNPILAEADATSRDAASSIRRIEPLVRSSRDERRVSKKWRTLDGTDNHRRQRDLGAAHTELRRLVPSDYADGLEAPAGADRPSARAVSNALSAAPETPRLARWGSDYIWQWGQFLDHDIDLTDAHTPAEPFPIPVPATDRLFDPLGSGAVTINLNRSLYNVRTGATEPRQQINEITAWIDASNVYGSDMARADALRSHDGTGRLATSPGDLLPFNVFGLPNAGGDSDALFLAGDVRANEQLGLIAIHTLFVREHNRYVARLAKKRRTLTGDELYLHGRAYVGALMQSITYNEFLPALIGEDALRPYRGYKRDRAGGISNLFSTAAYRFGHSLLSPTILRRDKNGEPIEQGDLALRDAFFRPSRIVDEGGIAPILRGLAMQRCRQVDPFVVDDLRNFLFGRPGAGGFDLAALNIQRGRDHGLPSYNDTRSALGLGRRASFAEVSSDADIQARLARAYGTVDDIDVWIGGLAEDKVEGAMVGELIRAVLVEQYTRLRDGDRFWYQRYLKRSDQRLIERTTLSQIIRKNTTVGRELPRDVFRIR